ncbi:MAG: ATP-binding protein, partial [Bdellovibrionota bacterium]
IRERSLFDELFYPLPVHLLIRLIGGFGCIIFTMMYARLQSSEHKLRLMKFVVESSADWVIWADRRGRIRYANAAASEQHGYSPAEMLRLSIPDIDPLFPAEAWEAHWHEVKQKGHVRLESFHRTKSGKIFPVEITTGYIWTSSGGLLCGIVRNISERKAAHEMLKKGNEALALAQNIARVGSFNWDVTTDTTEFSSEIYHLLGVGAEVPLTREAFFSYIHPADSKRVMETFNQDFRAKRPHTSEHRLILPNGVELWVHCRGEFTLDPAGNIVRMVGTVHDITERKKVELALSESEERGRLLLDSAEKANRAKDLFLAILSHELRTPLTAILSWAQLLKSGKLDPSKAKTGLQVIEESAHSQNQLISDLLDISRITSGKIAIETQNVELKAIVGEAIDTVRGMALKKSLHIVEQLGSVPLFILADAGRLKQIIWNLLSNSIKFTEPGGKIEVTLILCDDLAERKAQIQIRDTGKGISADFMPHIFEQFAQADPSSIRKHGGLGLGLALVQRLVTLQGGMVEAQSEGEGKGATFTVTFPLSVAVSDSEKEKLSTPVDLSGIHVLFVDDEASARQSIGEVLSSFGAQVQMASSVPEAVAEFEKSRPDVIVSDIAMPLEDGNNLMRRIRKLSHGKGGDTPAVALTAYADSESRELALSVGYKAYLAKPVDSYELAQTILRVTSKKEVLPA